MESNNSPKEFETRLNGLIQIMEQEKLEGILIYSNMLRRENLRYFTNFNPLEPDALALFSSKGDGMLLLPIGTEERRAKSTSWVKSTFSFDGDLSKAIDISKKMRIQKRLGVAGWEYTPMNLIIQIKKTFPNVKLVNVTPLVHRIRAIKSEAEIQRIEKAAQIADSAFGYLIENLKPGMKEYEIIALTEYKIRQSQGEDNFQLLTSSQGESRAMHPPYDKTVDQGDLFLTEISPQFDGYFAQICRSVVIGKISPERQKAHDILFNAQQKGIEDVRPGMTASDLAKIQNDVFRREGFGEYVTEKYTRGRGHGIGLYIDEEPLIEESNNYELEENMVIMIHPNTFLPISGYIVLGDPVLITENGGKRLSQSERKLISVH
jgi:Xaa-Pro dipeptidase